MSTRARGYVVQVRVSPAEKRAAERVAKDRSATVAETVRQLISEAQHRIEQRAARR